MSILHYNESWDNFANLYVSIYDNSSYPDKNVPIKPVIKIKYRKPKVLTVNMIQYKRNWYAVNKVQSIKQSTLWRINNRDRFNKLQQNYRSKHKLL